MKRIIASRLYKTKSEFLPAPVVEISDDGFVKNFYTIEGDIPDSEWLGGVLILSSRELLPNDFCIENVVVLDDILSALNPDYPDNFPYYVWRVNGIDSRSGKKVGKEIIVDRVEGE